MRGAAVPCRQPPACMTPASLLVVPQQAYQHPLHRRHQPHWPPQQQRRGSASAVASQQQHQEQQWESLSDVVWEGSEEAALAVDSPLAAEQPLWRLLLLSDGSVTRHLQLLTGTAVKVDCLAMAPVPEGADSGLPAAADALAHPLLQREVRWSTLLLTFDSISSSVPGTLRPLHRKAPKRQPHKICWHVVCVLTLNCQALRLVLAQRCIVLPRCPPLPRLTTFPQ